ncbi:MAG: amino acid adenylation domain-containing protein [Chloroflexi bacterium]|nr:amino acid adenylation domain-containing protein [Chloroflexota bacterium]
MIYLLSHILDESAQRYPDHPAMRFAGQTLTYGEWHRRANALARVLVEQGVRRGDRVGIYLRKGIETPIAIYGIWKAGAAYVPLDPLAPVARLNFVVNDCAIRHIVSQENKVDALRDIAMNSPLECVIGVAPREDVRARGVPWDALDGRAVPAPDILLTEQDLAYVMYTSGSTGTPKGLMHTHASGLAYARLSADLYGVTHTDRLSNHSPLHFDMSTFDYFTGPLCGATTVIIPEPTTKFPASMSKLIEDERLTIWYSVTTALVQLVLRGVLPSRDVSSLRWILYGGEPFPPKHLRELMRLIPRARVSNVYGPAEVNQCTYYHVPQLADDYAESIPIGRVWDNSEGILLDENDQPARAGDIGELVVRTPTMMRGYWGRPDLNARAFYRRQVFEQYDDVFYRTGDLMRVDADGLLRFCGRKDRQIKTRGYRVELDEVENALSLNAAVGECAVYAVPDGEGSQWVEAAVILKKETPIPDLRNDLAQRVPPYAVPHKILVLDDFPRTGTGKIDRRALREQAIENNGHETT